MERELSAAVGLGRLTDSSFFSLKVRKAVTPNVREEPSKYLDAQRETKGRVRLPFQAVQTRAWRGVQKGAEEE